MAAHVGERRRVDREGACEPREVPAQLGAFARPAADAEIRVVALREQPPVAPGRGAELDHGSRREAVTVEQLPRDVALERDAAHDAALQSDRLRDDPVGTVCADEHVGGYP